MAMIPAFPKFQKGRTLQEERAEKRETRESFEETEKRKVRKRDPICRWPRCDCGKHRLRLEVAHIENKGSGGDHGRRSSAAQMVRLCVRRHQGPVSLHSGDLEIEYLTPERANGPLAFYQRGEDGKLFMVAQETAPFVYLRD